MMVRWMCGVTLKNRVSSVELYSLLNADAVSEVVRRGRLVMLNVRVRTMGFLPVESWRLRELNGKGGVGNRGKSV